MDVHHESWWMIEQHANARSLLLPGRYDSERDARTVILLMAYPAQYRAVRYFTAGCFAPEQALQSVGP